MKHLLLTAVCIMALGYHAQAQEIETETNMIEELNPFDSNIENTLRELDQRYMEETGLSPFLEGGTAHLYENENIDLGLFENTILEKPCYRIECPVFAHIKKNEQKMYLYVNGQLQDSWLVSTGLPQHETPNFDKNPNGRIYDKYSSSKFPGGDYMGLGNMPYAVFIHGGFAMHGTPVGNYSKLGRKASHGCVRMHSENGRIFNRLVRQYGISNTWITITDN